jgi:ADP-ribosylglycohydrolase
MAGGDSAARALVLGMVLGAQSGKQALPERWVEGLKSAPRVEAFLGKIA